MKIHIDRRPTKRFKITFTFDSKVPNTIHFQRQFSKLVFFSSKFQCKNNKQIPLSTPHLQSQRVGNKKREQATWLLFCNLNEIKIKKVLLSSQIRVHILSYNFVEKTIFSVANLVSSPVKEKLYHGIIYFLSFSLIPRVKKKKEKLL